MRTSCDVIEMNFGCNMESNKKFKFVLKNINLDTNRLFSVNLFKKSNEISRNIFFK